MKWITVTVARGGGQTWKVVCDACGLVDWYSGKEDTYAFAVHRKEQHASSHDRTQMRAREARRDKEEKERNAQNETSSNSRTR